MWICLGITSRTEFQVDEEETIKEFLPRLSTGNGDIRPSSSSLKQQQHHHHHSRSRHAPPIVLIPQQSHALSSSPILTNSRSHHHLFNSNMYLLEKHLKHLITRQKNEEERNEIINEWKLMALIMDRLFFWLFTFFTLISTVLCLIIIPFLKNAGYIPAISKVLLADYKLTETLSSIIEEHVRTNLTDVSTVDT